MSMQFRITEDTNLVGTVQTATGTGSWYTDVIDLSCAQGRRFAFYVNVGTIGSSATVDFNVRASATSGGTYADVSNTAITQDTTGSKTHVVEVSTEQIIAAVPTAKFIKGYLKVGTASTPTGVIAIARDASNIPVTSAASAVGQTVTTVG